jgi:non-ribosomal peptide synthetase component F
MALMAGFKALLMRYSGEEDVVVGTVIANRARREIEGLIGFFANTLALRTDLSGNPSVAESVRREREVALGAYGRQEAPFERLVEEINPQRDLSRTPLFQVLMTLENTRRGELGIRGPNMAGIEKETVAAKFDLSLNLMESEEGIGGVLEFSHDLYGRETIKRMVKHYERVLEEMVRDPMQRIREIDLVSEAEKKQIIEVWNETAKPYPDGLCIHDLFEHQVNRTPESVALTYGNQQLTYTGLNEKANRLARYLRRLGVGPDTLVGIYLERGLEMVVGLVGILKAGGSYVPLDPTYPVERIALALEDARVKALLTGRKLLEALPSSGAQVVTMDAVWRMVDVESEANLLSGATADSLAYAIYTSGSTGRPKGVLVPHRQVINFFTAMDAYLEPDPADIWLAVTSISFDISVLELLWTLTRGLHVVVYGERRMTQAAGEPYGGATGQDFGYGEISANDEDFSVAEQIARRQVSHFQCTPSMAKIVSMEASSRNTFSSLRKLLIGGEAFPVGLAENLKLLVTAEIRNMYGPTETTIWSATYPLSGAESRIPIGRPIANTQIYILDRELKIVPVGVPGELHIGGKGVVRGYLAQSDLTSERFIPDQFSAEPGARLYLTGDRARYLADGNIEFLGRIDHQVKIRGFRVELGEIEVVLSQHPAVRETVVIVSGDEDKRLIAYLVSRDEQRATLSELRQYLKQRLPEYMIPSGYVWLEKIPLTSNGKLDRRALPATDEAGTARGREYVAPSGPVEEALAGIWSELLGVEKVGVHDDFFELGGHSLLLTQVVSRIRAAFSLDLPLRAMFDAPTIRQLGLAIAVEQLREADSIDASELLQELQQLSPQEIEAMLESEVAEDFARDLK